MRIVLGVLILLLDPLENELDSDAPDLELVEMVNEVPAANDADASRPPLDVDAIRTHADAILRDPVFAFCHDADYPLIDTEAGWCEWADAARARCPALVTICERPRAALVGPPGRLALRSSPGDDAPEQDDQRGQGGGPGRIARDPTPAAAPELPAFQGLAMVLFWTALLAAAGIIVHAVVSYSRRSPPAARGSETPEPTAEPDLALARERAREVETDVDRLLALARAAAERGEVGEAVDLAHAALLRRLDHEGLIHLHHARTNGDYLRELGAHTLGAPVRAALRDVDRLQFGREPPTRAAFDALFDRIGVLARRAGAVLVLVFLFTSMVSCGERKTYPWSASPSGTEGTLRLLRGAGFSIDYRTRPLLELEDDRVLIMLDGSTATADEWAALDTWMRNGHTLILANGEVPERFGPSIAHDVNGRPRRGPIWDRSDGFVTHGLELPSAPPIQIEYTSLAVLVRDDGSPYMVQTEHGLGSLIVFPRDHLFTNAALAMDGNPVFLVELLRAFDPDTQFELVDAWADLGADTPLESIQNSKLTAAMVQLLVLVLALFMFRGTRFGLARDPRPPHRRAFSQHARALGSHYGLARADLHAAALYATWVLERWRDRLGTPSLHRLAQELARRSGRDETAVMRLLVEADTAVEAATRVANEPTRRSRVRDEDGLRLIAELGALVRETGGSP